MVVWTEDYKRSITATDILEIQSDVALQVDARPKVVIDPEVQSPRFFDLVCWGIAAETLNGYLTGEITQRSYLGAGHFRKNQDEYLPIPNTEITLSEKLYVQNTGTW